MRPITGVALMIIITVALACVISAFVFGMVGHLPQSNSIESGTLESGTLVREETFKVVSKIHTNDRYIVVKQESLLNVIVTKEDYDQIQVDKFYNFKVYDRGAFQSYLYKVDWETS